MRPQVTFVCNVRDLLARVAQPPRPEFMGAARLAEAASNVAGRVARSIRRAHDRHPLAYRADQLARQLGELAIELRRESTK